MLSGYDILLNRAYGGRWARLSAQPLHYLWAMTYQYGIYPLLRRPFSVKALLFFGRKMHILLPASTDIYLTRGKSHDSEVRLAAYMMNTLKKGDTFVDIGAHYGYFTLLAHALVGDVGHILSVEPANEAKEVLIKNVASIDAITVIPKVVGQEDGNITFYSFPTAYAEYNTTDIKPYEGAAWFISNPPEKHTLPSINLESLVAVLDKVPDLIKIDAEGGEADIIKGSLDWLAANKPPIAMEFLFDSRSSSHQVASELLLSIGYSAFSIQPEGAISPIDDASNYKPASAITSDNLIFL